MAKEKVTYKGKDLDPGKAIEEIKGSEKEFDIQRFLNRDQIERLADDFGIEFAALKAVIDVESGGSGFDKTTGFIKIQFEPYHFRKYTGIKVRNGVDSQRAEYIAYNHAVGLGHEESAMLSTSWGLMQVMGFNHERAGFDNVREMVNEFKKAEYYQLMGALNFIKSNDKMYRALQNKDWSTFARYYNGAGYERFNYDQRLKKAYKKWA